MYKLQAYTHNQSEGHIEICIFQRTNITVFPSFFSPSGLTKHTESKPGTVERPVLCCTFSFPVKKKKKTQHNGKNGLAQFWTSGPVEICREKKGITNRLTASNKYLPDGKHPGSQVFTQYRYFLTCS